MTGLNLASILLSKLFQKFNFFLQSTLVCTFPQDSIPCSESPNFYEGADSINSKFGFKTFVEENIDPLKT
jgi:hypothetical protein